MYNIFTDKTPTQKLFYYEIEEMFTLTRDDSLYRRFIPSEIDQYIHITEDRRSVYNILSKRAAAEAQVVLQSLNKDLIDAFIYNKLPEATVEELNDATDFSDGLVYKMTDDGTLTLGTVAVVADDKVYYNEATSVWIKDNAKTEKYILYYLDMPFNYPLNNIISFDQKLEEFISVWIIKEWFKRQKYDLELILMEIENLRDELRSLVSFRTSHYRPMSVF